MFEYNTIQFSIENILTKEKNSKFIGFAFPVFNEKEIKNALEKLQEKHPKATHHCYAFRIGLKGENYRMNDDGEPLGSAGLPIYNQLLAHNVTNILLVVIRYFGGTKLGVGGLVKAYKESAKLTLDKTTIITKQLKSIISLTFPFECQNTVFTLLNKFDAKIQNFNTQRICSIQAKINTSQKENISKILSGMHLISFEFLD